MKYTVIKKKLLEDRISFQEKRLLKLKKVIKSKSLVENRITKLEKKIQNLDLYTSITLQ